MDKIQDKNRFELTNIQKVIGRRMEFSKRNQPCFSINIVADITELNMFRRKSSRKLKARLTTNDFFFMAMSNATCQYPLMAGRIDGDNIKISESVNVGFAVSGQNDRLLVPVIKATNNLDIIGISVQTAELVQKAKIGKLTPDEMSGATIALSSLGMMGIDAFIAILPPDMTSILAIGRPKDTLTVVDGEIKTRKLISLTLSSDQRIVCPEYAAKFLQLIAEQLEQPQTLI